MRDTHAHEGCRVGKLLAGGATKILNEGWVLLLDGALCILGAWLAAWLQPGFRKYDAATRSPRGRSLQASLDLGAFGDGGVECTSITTA
jgi:hypothetical protein